MLCLIIYCPKFIRNWRLMIFHMTFLYYSFKTQCTMTIQINFPSTNRPNNRQSSPECQNRLVPSRSNRSHRPWTYTVRCNRIVVPLCCWYFINLISKPQSPFTDFTHCPESTLSNRGEQWWGQRTMTSHWRIQDGCSAIMVSDIIFGSQTWHGFPRKEAPTYYLAIFYRKLH